MALLAVGQHRRIIGGLPRCGPAAQRSRQCRAARVSPPEIPEVFFVRPQIGCARTELPETDNAFPLAAQVVRLQNAQSFAHHLRWSPTQLADEYRQPLSRPLI